MERIHTELTKSEISYERYVRIVIPFITQLDLALFPEYSCSRCKSSTLLEATSGQSKQTEMAQQRPKPGSASTRAVRSAHTSLNPPAQSKQPVRAQQRPEPGKASSRLVRSPYTSLNPAGLQKNPSHAANSAEDVALEIPDENVEAEDEVFGTSEATSSTPVSEAVVSYYTRWTWWAPHGSFYAYRLGRSGTEILETLWHTPPITSPSTTGPRFIARNMRETS